MKFLLLSFLAGIVAACGFEPIGWWPLTILAFAGLLWLVQQAPSLRGALARGWWFGVGHFTLGLNWIATAFTFQSNMPASLGWVAVVLLALYLAIYPAMATGLAWRWGGARSPAEAGVQHDRDSGPRPSPGNITFILLFAAAWVVTEWLRATMFTGFAWNPLGAALLPTGIAGAARVVGTYGVSGMAVLLAGGVLLLAQRRWRGGAALFAGVLALVLMASLVHRAAPAAPGIPLRIVQPNIGQQDKWKPGFERVNFERLERLSASSDPGPRLLLWPEAAVTNPLQDGRGDPYHRARARALRERVGAILAPGDLLLTGGITIQSSDGARATSATNSVFAMNPAGEILARYDKAHLVPYGEYLPMRPILSRLGLSRLAPGDIDFDSGPGPRTLDIPAIGPVGFQLCYEIIFSGEVVDPGRRPAFIFNPSNDAWFGAWGPPQHLAQARMRALEEGLPVLRSTPTGISAVIDARGEVLHSLPWRMAGAIDARLPPPAPPTLFAKLGNILPFLFALMLAGIAIALTRKKR